MLDLNAVRTHGWRHLLLELLPSAETNAAIEMQEEDPANGVVDELSNLFNDALQWALGGGYRPKPKHTLEKYVNQYRRTLDDRNGPVIPMFLRVYCATRTGRRYLNQTSATPAARTANRSASTARLQEPHTPRTNAVFMRA